MDPKFVAQGEGRESRSTNSSGQRFTLHGVSLFP